MLTLEKAKELIAPEITEEHLLLHSLNVCYAMGAMACHFGQDEGHWQAVGMLHDYDYEKYPEEHLRHTAEPLRAAGVDEEDISGRERRSWPSTARAPAKNAGASARCARWTKAH